MLLGEYEHTIDDKNRLTLPARFREAFAGGVVVTRGMDGCLYAYPRDDWRASSGSTRSAARGGSYSGISSPAPPRPSSTGRGA